MKAHGECHGRATARGISKLLQVRALAGRGGGWYRGSEQRGSDNRLAVADRRISGTATLHAKSLGSLNVASVLIG